MLYSMPSLLGPTTFPGPTTNQSGAWKSQMPVQRTSMCPRHAGTMSRRAAMAMDEAICRNIADQTNATPKGNPIEEK